jgi:hypothetical protein
MLISVSYDIAIPAGNFIFGIHRCIVMSETRFVSVFTLNFLPYRPIGPVSSNIYRSTINSAGPNLKTTLTTISD